MLHLGDLFVEPPKIIKFNRWFCLKNESSTKLNHIFDVKISFYARNAIKKWSQECSQKQSLLFNFCNIFWSVDI